MRTLDFVDGFDSESVPGQGSTTANADKVFANDAAFVTDKGSAAAEGDHYSNSTTNLARRYDGSAWLNSDTQNSTSISAKVADYVILDDDGIGVIHITTAGVNRTVTLPTAADNVDRIITLIKVDTGAGHVDFEGEGAELIDQNLFYRLQMQDDAFTVQSNGVGWFTTSSVEAEVSVSYESNAGVSIPDSVAHVLNFEDKVYDSANNGADLVTIGAAWKFTAPKDGRYMIHVYVLCADFAWTVGEILSAHVRVGGVDRKRISLVDVSVTATRKVEVNGSCMIPLGKGNEIDVTLFQDSGSPVPTQSVGDDVYIVISRLKRF